MKAAIIEDEPIVSRQINDLTKLFFQGKEKEILVHSYLKGRELIKDLEDGQRYDFYLMDLRLPDLDGVELIEKIRKNQKDAEIIVVSAHLDRVLECVHGGIFDFVPKTTKLQGELNRVLEKLWTKIEENKERYYYISGKKDIQKILIDNIYYIEMIERRAIFHCREGDYSEYRPLKDIYPMLPAKDFVYINNGQVINLWRVRQASGECVLLDNGISLTISRRKRKDFTDQFLKYYGRKR